MFDQKRRCAQHGAPLHPKQWGRPSLGSIEALNFPSPKWILSPVKCKQLSKPNQNNTFQIHWFLCIILYLYNRFPRFARRLIYCRERTVMNYPNPLLRARQTAGLLTKDAKGSCFQAPQLGCKLSWYQNGSWKKAFGAFGTFGAFSKLPLSCFATKPSCPGTKLVSPLQRRYPILLRSSAHHSPIRQKKHTQHTYIQMALKSTSLSPPFMTCCTCSISHVY